jgi:hypothetical protein
MLQRCAHALGLCLAFGFAASPVDAIGDCPTPTRMTEAEVNADYDSITYEVKAMEPPYELGFRIGDQRIFRGRTRSEITSDDRIADRLGALKPRLETLFSEVGAGSGRPVLVVESRTNTFGRTLAFVSCEDTAEAAHRDSYLSELLPGVPLPNGACLMVVYPGRIDGGDYLDFVLAHEWMHTRQHDAYGPKFDGGDWWREGSAEWFAHKAFSGFTGRDDVIKQFFNEQRICPLNEISYPSQVFFFWGEKEFYSRWVFEHGIYGEDALRDTANVAELLPPERWLDWAKAQADDTITLPDGRALPISAPVEPILIGSACKAAINGPPLSAQIRQTEFPPGAEGPLRVETGGAQVALKPAGGDWVDLADGAAIDPVPAGPVTIAAIQPDAGDLSVKFSLGDDAEDACSCYVGSWMEQPDTGLLPGDQYELRGDEVDALVAGMLAAGGSDMQIDVDYRHDGPVLTIAPDGNYRVDDPVTATVIDTATGAPALFDGKIVWRLKDSQRQDYGKWSEEENGFLRLQGVGRRLNFVLTSMGASNTIAKDRRRRGWDDWTPVCDDGQLHFYLETAAELAAATVLPEPKAVFVRVPTP